MKWMVLMMAWVVAMPLWAADLETDLADIQQRWAGIQYQLPENKREKAFEGLVKDARKSLEAALAIDAGALDGSAHTSLGSLYYQVPGWPLGFGDDDKARNYLQKALAINPEGIDANYFFGDFLLEQREPERAQTYLRKVLEVPDRPGRNVADAGRRKEAKKLLENI